MNTFLVPIIVAAIVGAGVVTGLLFAFSNFVMRALSDMPAEQGMHAMQRINERIINPIFLLFFFGTPIASVVILFLTISAVNLPGYAWLLVGAILYLIGPFGITVTRNVPLNNKLALTSQKEAGASWPRYIKAWQFWNHIRSYIGVVSIACLAIGLAGLEH
ncbi:MAG: DUF1772 domain-containing protein [Neptuniibacter sp.]